MADIHTVADCVKWNVRDRISCFDAVVKTRSGDIAGAHKWCADFARSLGANQDARKASRA